MSGLVAALRTVGFMVGVGLLTLVVCALTWLTHPVDPRDRMFSAALRWLGRCWFRLAGARIEIQSAVPLDELFSRPVFLAGNHQSTLDIPLLALAAGGRIRFFAKRSLFWIPIFGWSMWLKGFTPVDRANARRTRPALDDAMERLRHGVNSFVVFPEGTRSVTGDLLPYRRGSFSLARRAGVPVVPFALDGTGRVMPKGSWGTTRGTVRLRLGPPIETGEAGNLSVDELMNRAREFTATALGELQAAR